MRKEFVWQITKFKEDDFPKLEVGPEISDLPVGVVIPAIAEAMINFGVAYMKACVIESTNAVPEENIEEKTSEEFSFE